MKNPKQKRNAKPALIRTIQTVYKRGNRVVKINTASYANNAVLNCVHHMQHDHYGATLAEVYDSHTGVLHAVVVRTLKGMHIVFKRDIKENESEYSHAKKK